MDESDDAAAQFKAQSRDNQSHGTAYLAIC